MKNLITKQGLMFAGIGLLTAIVVYKVITREKKTETASTTTKSVDATSSFCGCGA